nr:hypothetical protein [Tanacetum cinerariifolium]
MRADEMYKFSHGTLKTVRDELRHRILDFRLGYNDEMSRRKWTAIDNRISELMVKLTYKRMRERHVIRNLKRLVGAQELDMDNKLMTRTTPSSPSPTRHSHNCHHLISINIITPSPSPPWPSTTNATTTATSHQER